MTAAATRTTDDTILRLRARLDEEISSLRALVTDGFKSLSEAQARLLSREEHDAEIASLRESLAQQRTAARQKHDADITALRTTMAQQRASAPPPPATAHTVPPPPTSAVEALRAQTVTHRPATQAQAAPPTSQQRTDAIPPLAPRTSFVFEENGEQFRPAPAGMPTHDVSGNRNRYGGTMRDHDTHVTSATSQDPAGESSLRQLMQQLIESQTHFMRSLEKNRTPTKTSRTAPSSDDKDDDADGDHYATDEDSDASCYASVERRKKRELALPREQRYTATLLCMDMTRDNFIAAWTQRLNRNATSSQREKEEVTTLLERLLVSYDMLVAANETSDTHAKTLHRAAKAHRVLLQDAMRTLLRQEHALGYVCDAVREQFEKDDVSKRFVSRQDQRQDRGLPRTSELDPTASSRPRIVELRGVDRVEPVHVAATMIGRQRVVPTRHNNGTQLLMSAVWRRHASPKAASTTGSASLFRACAQRRCLFPVAMRPPPTAHEVGRLPLGEPPHRRHRQLCTTAHRAPTRQAARQAATETPVRQRWE
jgi:hypothetical protein